jgi:ferredoxin
MCTLCGGSPQCVKQCPQGALRHMRVRTWRKFYGMPAEDIAAQLSARWYGE